MIIFMFTVVTMHRVTDPVVVAVCVEKINRGFYQTLNLFGKSEILWHLCGGCQWKEYPGVANPEIVSMQDESDQYIDSCR